MVYLQLLSAVLEQKLRIGFVGSDLFLSDPTFFCRISGVYLYIGNYSHPPLEGGKITIKSGKFVRVFRHF
jgi:hypothetical protein